MRERSAPGRPREFDPDEKLDLIMNLFWKSGYEGTSLADIVAATELKKGSLYKAYGDKHAMYLKALARYEKAAVDGAVAILTGPEPGAERLKRLLTVPIDAAWEGGDFRGCFLCNAATDRAAEDAEIARIVQGGFARMAAAAGAALRDAGMAEGAVQGRAYAILAVYSGLRGMARIGVSRETLEQARDATLAG